MTFIYVAVRSIDDQAYLENKFVKIPALVTFLGIVFTTISLVDDFDDIVLILKETGRAILASKWTLMFPLLKNVLLWSIFIFGINLMPLYHKELSLRPPFEAIIVSLNLMAIIWLMAWIYGLFEMVHSGKFTGWYKAFYANKKFEKSYGHYFWTAITMNSGTAVIGGLMPFGHLICFIFSGIIAILSIPFYFFLPSIYTKIAKFVENRILNHMHYDNVYIVTSNYHTSLIESIVLIANDNLWKFTRKSKVTIVSYLTCFI
ncbi:uncharacterized protein LOC106649957 [Trichogramma pretiosum]|uniref:uncharacterized protein LOC106649957 n=1 Tax=Trichogramma pretiosum TaxID=7493 RepID=UPI000C71AB07|nr:uncharacterized protein LOC106649957 [Trichogramma pretiosum]